MCAHSFWSTQVWCSVKCIGRWEVKEIKMQYHTCKIKCSASPCPPLPIIPLINSIPSLYAGCTSTEAHSSQLKEKLFFHTSDLNLTGHTPESPWRWPPWAPWSWKSTDISNTHILQLYLFYICRQTASIPGDRDCWDLTQALWDPHQILKCKSNHLFHADLSPIPTPPSISLGPRE